MSIFSWDVDIRFSRLSWHVETELFTFRDWSRLSRLVIDCLDWSRLSHISETLKHLKTFSSLGQDWWETYLYSTKTKFYPVETSKTNLWLRFQQAYTTCQEDIDIFKTSIYQSLSLVKLILTHKTKSWQAYINKSNFFWYFQNMN